MMKKKKKTRKRIMIKDQLTYCACLSNIRFVITRIFRALAGSLARSRSSRSCGHCPFLLGPEYFFSHQRRQRRRIISFPFPVSPNNKQRAINEQSRALFSFTGKRQARFDFVAPTIYLFPSPSPEPTLTFALPAL